MPTDELTEIPVHIQNWPDAWGKPPTIKATTIKTYILNPAASDTTQRWAQIAEYEPKRARLAIQPLDANVTLTLEQPQTSPDTSVAAGPPPQGGVLAFSVGYQYCFYGPDAMWINSLAAVTRVVVVKEYYG